MPGFRLIAQTTFQLARSNEERIMKRLSLCILCIFALTVLASDTFSQTRRRPADDQPRAQNQRRNREGEDRRQGREADQGGESRRGGNQRGGAQRGGGSDLLFRTLDVNRDGKISATEIENAQAALKKLDKNNDGQLTRNELRPERERGGQRGGRNAEGGTDGARRRQRGGDRQPSDRGAGRRDRPTRPTRPQER